MPSSPTAPPRIIPDTPLPDARLADHLSRVPDPRQARGKRYPVPGVLLVAVSAAMAGCRGFTATGEWAARLTDKNLNEFALRSAPGESTLRETRRPHHRRPGRAPVSVRLDPHHPRRRAT